MTSWKGYSPVAAHLEWTSDFPSGRKKHQEIKEPSVPGCDLRGLAFQNPRPHTSRADVSGMDRCRRRSSVPIWKEGTPEVWTDEHPVSSMSQDLRPSVSRGDVSTMDGSFQGMKTFVATFLQLMRRSSLISGISIV